MGDLYSVRGNTLTTGTITMKNDFITTKNQPYEEIVADLCRCMLQAIAIDDVNGKMLIGVALHSSLAQILGIAENEEELQ
jgi:hypothetical protein